MIIEFLALALVEWAISKYAFPAPQETESKKDAFAQFQLPRAEEGGALPLFWGRVRVTSPIVLYARHFAVTPIKESVGGDTVTIGYRYRMGLQFLIGVPGKSVGSGPQSKLVRMWYGDRQAWVGELYRADNYAYVVKTHLLGGKGAGGGLHGLVYYMPGNGTQTNPTTVRQLLTTGTSPVNGDVAYRHQAVVTLLAMQNSGGGAAGDLAGITNTADGDVVTEDDIAEFVANHPLGAPVAGGFELGESPQLDGISFEVFAPTYKTLDGHLVGPIGKDANPVCVLYDVLTEAWDRIGLDPSLIDEPSFYAAAAKVASDAERNGFSLLVSAATSSRDVVRLILEQIDGILYDDPETGKMVLTLVREDYDLDDLDTIDPDSGIEVVDWQQGSWEGTFNEIRVTFTDRSLKYKDAPAAAQDMANFYASDQKFRPRDVHYPGCTVKSNADKLASRDLRAGSLPLAKMKIAVNRSAYALRPGDVFKFTWPDFDGMTEVPFRVLAHDLGKLGGPEGERVVLDCVQDRFAFKKNSFRVPVSHPVANADPFPPTDTHRTESPLWLAQRAAQLGRIVDPFSGGRHMYLAAPRSNASSMHAEVLTSDGEEYAQDVEPQPYPGRARVAVDYPRYLDPYDTGVGLVINEVEGWTPAAASSSDIKLYGKNLLMLVDDDGNEEIVSFQTATDNLDGSWTLGNVGRGNLDTVPRDWTAGARAWVLANGDGAIVTRVGRISLEYAQVATSRFATHGLGKSRNVSAAPDVDVSSITTTLRQTLPYPVADLLVGCESAAIGDAPSKSPDVLVEGGVDIAWTRRNRFSEVILRGDEADEDPEPDTTYKPVAYVFGEDGSIESLATLGDSVDYAQTSIDGAMLGAAGYGTLGVGVHSECPTRAVNPAAPRVSGAAYIPTVNIEAPEWRNLLRNGRFDDGLNGWTTNAGTPAAATSSSGLGGGGYYLKGDGGSVDAEVTQTVSIAGFTPNRLTAELDFDHRQLTDTTDTLTVTLESLDSGGSTLDTVSSGTVTPSSTEWTHATISIANLDPDARSLRVTIHLTDVGGVDAPKAIVTEVILRVGQRTSQLLLNADFQTILPSVFTNWTNVSNSFVSDTTAPLYIGSRYARPGNFASSEIKQEVSVPAGWTVGSTLVLELGRANHNADGDKGEVIVEALNGGGSILATQTTGMEAISPSGTWQRRRIHLDLPEDTATIRVRLLGQRVSGTPCDTAFDDLDLRLWKWLGAETAQTFEFDTPASHPIVPDYDYFDRAYLNVPAPNLCFWHGDSSAGLRGTEPSLETTDDAGTATTPATVGAKFVGAYDGTRNGTVLSEAYDFPIGCDAGLGVDDPSFASFASTDAFAFWVDVKVDQNPDDYVVLGRVGTYGYELATNSDGHAVARIKGAGGTVEAEGTCYLADRGVHRIGLHYDGAGGLTVIDDLGIVSVDATSAGEFDEDSSIVFKVGEPTGNGGSIFVGQMANVLGWYVDVAGDPTDVIDPSTMLGTITQGDPADSHLSQTRVAGSRFACVVGTDADGVLVGRFGEEQIPFAYDETLTADGGTGYGFPHQLAVTNRVREQDQDQSTGDWHTAGGATVSTAYGVGVEGRKDSFSVTGDNTKGRELRGLLGMASSYCAVSFFARAATAHTARLDLNNASDVNKGHFDYSVTTEWQQFWHVFSAWDNSTPTFRLRFCGSSDGTSRQVEVCGPFFASPEPRILAAIPLSTDDGTSMGYVLADLAGETLTRQHTLEGEIQVVGVCPQNPTPGTYDVFQMNDATEYRVLQLGSSSEPQFEHDSTDSSISTAAAQTWDALWTLRGRWNMAGLLDASSKYAGVLFGDALSDPSHYDRVARWTDTGETFSNVQFGGGIIGDALPFICRSVTIRTRERRLTP